MCFRPFRRRWGPAAAYNRLGSLRTSSNQPSRKEQSTSRLLVALKLLYAATRSTNANENGPNRLLKMTYSLWPLSKHGLTHAPSGGNRRPTDSDEGCLPDSRTERERARGEMEFCEIMAYENGGNGFVWFGGPAIFLENVRSSAFFSLSTSASKP